MGYYLDRFFKIEHPYHLKRMDEIYEHKSVKKESDMEMLNRVEIKGIIGNVRFQEYKVNVVRMSVYTDYAYRTKNGEAVVDRTWHSVTYFLKPEDSVEEFRNLQGGDKVHIEGRLRMNRYQDGAGVERTIIEVIAQKCRKIKE